MTDTLHVLCRFRALTIRRTGEYLPGGSIVVATIRAGDGRLAVDTHLDTSARAVTARQLGRYLAGLDLAAIASGVDNRLWRGVPCRACSGHGQVGARTTEHVEAVASYATEYSGDRGYVPPRGARYVTRLPYVGLVTVDQWGWARRLLARDRTCEPCAGTGYVGNTRDTRHAHDWWPLDAEEARWCAEQRRSIAA